MIEIQEEYWNADLNKALIGSVSVRITFVAFVTKLVFVTVREYVRGTPTTKGPETCFDTVITVGNSAVNLPRLCPSDGFPENSVCSTSGADK